MSITAVSIPYDRWVFKEPDIITEAQFHEFKNRIAQSWATNLAPDTNKIFDESVKSSWFGVGVGAIGVLASAMVDNNGTYGWIAGIGFILFLLGALCGVGLFKTYGTYKKILLRQKRLLRAVKGYYQRICRLSRF